MRIGVTVEADAGGQNPEGWAGTPRAHGAGETTARRCGPLSRKGRTTGRKASTTWPGWTAPLAKRSSPWTGGVHPRGGWSSPRAG